MTKIPWNQQYVVISQNFHTICSDSKILVFLQCDISTSITLLQLSQVKTWSFGLCWSQCTFQIRLIFEARGFSQNFNFLSERKLNSLKSTFSVVTKITYSSKIDIWLMRSRWCSIFLRTKHGTSHIETHESRLNSAQLPPK